MKQDILDAALAIFNKLTAGKTEIASDISQLIADFATSKVGEAAASSMFRNEVWAKRVDAVHTADAALADDKAEVVDVINRLLNAASTSLHLASGLAAKGKPLAVEAVSHTSAERQPAHFVAVAAKAALHSKFLTVDSYIVAFHDEQIQQSTIILSAYGRRLRLSPAA